VSLFFLTFIEWDTPWDFQITQLSKNCLKIFTFSFVIWNITNAHPHSLRYMKWLLIASVIIAGTYSIFLMQLEGLNPYTSFLAEYYDAKTDNAEIYSQAISRLSVSSAGKIQATMVHPMTWILHLSLLSVIFVAYLLKTGIKWYGILILFILFNIFISGVRTGIVALGIGFSYFLFKEKKIKIILSICIIIFFIISNNEDLSNIFNSFIDVNGDKSSIYGSSISMRLNQVEGVFQEISGLKLFTGKGYDWSDYYLLNYGTHPTILSFESFVFSALCNSGLIGIGLWLIFFSLLFRLQRKMLSVKTDIHLMDTMIFVYIGYIIGTGDYNYLFPFAIYYTFLMSILKHKIL
jgi:hypothetical protein